jgi:hypothetical protein
MSKKQLDNKFELMHVVWNSDLKAAQKNLLNYLLALADANGECFPNTDQVAKVCGVKNQRRLTPVVDQLPGLVSVNKKGRKNYYKVDLAAVMALEEKQVVLKVTPPTGANTPPVGANTPPNGGSDLPPTSGAYITSNTTQGTTLKSTLARDARESADAPSQDQDSFNNKGNQSITPLISSDLDDSPIIENIDVIVQVPPIDVMISTPSPIVSTTEEAGGAAAAAGPVQKGRAPILEAVNEKRAAKGKDPIGKKGGVKWIDENHYEWNGQVVRAAGTGAGWEDTPIDKEPEPEEEKKPEVGDIILINGHKVTYTGELEW